MQEKGFLIRNDFNESHRYHLNSYKCFTGNMNRLQKYDYKAIESLSEQIIKNQGEEQPFRKIILSSTLTVYSVNLINGKQLKWFFMEYARFL